MYTILLVDDEPTILNNLQNIIDWPVYGIEHVLTAKDGADALEKLKNTTVDLLITDISMPNMDGLELIENVKMSYPHIRCILLTSYSDFSYAKRAITLNVENYLLKPLQVEELDYSIRKSLENISMHNQTVQTLIMDNILYRWVSGDITEDELLERSKHLGINVYARQYCTVIIKNLRKKHSDPVISSFIASLSSSYDAWHFINYDGFHVIILGSHKIDLEYISEIFSQFLSENTSDRNFQVTIGYVADGHESVPQSYQSALECMMLTSSPKDASIVFASKKAALDFSNLRLNQIIENLNNTEDMNWILPTFHNLFPNLSEYTLEELNSFVNIIPAKLGLLLASSGLIDEASKDDIVNSSHHFEDFPTEKELFNWFLDILSVCQALVKKHTKVLSPIIASAMQYITENYSGYVSIKDFSSRHSMNASYLGLLFKKETGIYFNDFLNRLRVNHSIQLLKNTSLKITEIYQRSGFSSSSYFILCFRKHTGVSPAKFRKLYSLKQQSFIQNL